MQTSIVFLGLVGLALAGAVPKGSEFDFEHFKVKFEKSYENKDEEMYRKAVFDKAVEEIKQHNGRYISGLESYWMGVNHMTDKLHSEVIASGLALGDFKMEDESNFEAHFSDSIPDEVDWRDEEGVVQEVKNQGSCGSCWAFSTTGSLEGQMMLKQKKSVSLSEAQLVDCSKENGGCNGGLMKQAFDYIEKYGLESEEDYPYVTRQRRCKYDESKVVARITGSKMLKPTEDSLTQALANVGPISIAIHANSRLMRYHGGVFDDPSCTARGLNHGVLAVGYGTDGDKDFYIVKNSWGGYWGENGYVRMSRNKSNQCGIASYLVYPLVDEA